ncbi:MAG TPA: UDP-glucose--hexose-1-phosphate uridylyltransferase [Bacillota bacterium]|nr:UDP-glucose--hexose-1-phosphate uridylyltransferase [Bacillota bacterium]
MIYTLIESLINKAVEKELIQKRDSIYARNQLMNIFQLDDFPEKRPETIDDSIPNIIEKLVDYAAKKDLIENVFDSKEMLAANMMNVFMPRPSDVEKTFYDKYKQSPKAATEFFYQLSKLSNYIQRNRINKNISFTTESKYGELDITINLSKPEKDPEEIKRELQLKKENVDYPKCPLCVENEGYVGRIGYAARSNHRMISVPIEGETWYFQYSPYVYYNEHSILLCEEHRPMVINSDTFKRLFAFVEQFPHYFIGSNADLPIVGGSILSHDHYQAGHYSFAMEKAEKLFTFSMDKFPKIKASVLKWPLSVIRLESTDKNELTKAADDILQKWMTYSDRSVNIVAYTDEERHNTITPIVRKSKNNFQIDLVLRNNRTTETYPSGIFHPHEDVQHIKKENIGLIEVMGLAVLPARLKDELEEIKQFLQGKIDKVAQYHEPWAKALQTKYPKVSTNEEAQKIIEHELGKKFERILEDAGVFKQTEEGIEAFKQFIKHLNK